LALDLQQDSQLIENYRQHHQPGNVWPEVLASIRDAGILNMEIYQLGNRLFMIMDVDDSFSFQRKSAMDNDNPHVQQWEALMNQYQRPLPWGKRGEKWQPMECIFHLAGH